MRPLLVLLYPLVLIVGVARRALGRDTLLIRKPAGVPSYWITRAPVRDTQSYFSQASVAEGKSAAFAGSQTRTDAGGAGLLRGLFTTLAGFYAPRRRAAGAPVPEAREEGIPDEIYTLW